MNMKRIVFVAIGIFIMLVIIGFTLHSMRNIDKINQRRREQDKGESIASRMVVTTATTSIWDSLRQTETQTETGVTETISQESSDMSEDISTDTVIAETDLQNQEITQILTETVQNAVLIAP